MTDAPMTEEELASAVKRQVVDAEDFYSDETNQRNQRALKYYRGETDLKPMGKGRSTAVSKDVSDVVGLILPSLLRVFFATDRVAIIEPMTPEQEDRTEQDTQLLNYDVMSECGGYRQFHSVLWDSVLMGNGVLKHWWDDTPEYITEKYTGQDEARFKFLTGEPDVEEVQDIFERADSQWQISPEAEQQKLLIDEQAAQYGLEPVYPDELFPFLNAPKLYDFTLKKVKTAGRLCVEAVPHNEFRLDKAAKFVDETTRFAAHVFERTRSELIEDGYDQEKVNSLPKWTGESISERPDDSTYDRETDEAIDKSTQLVQVAECYVLVDFDGDGIAERRRVVIGTGAGADVLLANEEWDDDLPFTDFVCNPLPHQRRGEGVYDHVADLQEIKTVLWRGILDSVYRTARPTKYVAKDSIDGPMWDALVEEEYGAIIEYDPNKGGKPEDSTPPSIAPALAPVMDYIDAIAEKRTGVSQRSQALDLDALQNQSATAVNAAQSSAFTQIEYLARNLAEHGGFKRAMSCCARLLQKHYDKPKAIKLTGKWVEVDPRQWPTDIKLSINTGLGTGSRDRDLAMLSAISNSQEKVLAQFGPFEGPVTIKHWMETQLKMAEVAGIRNADQHIPQISAEDFEKMKMAAKESSQNKPDPQTAALQAKLQLEREKAQQDMALDTAKHQANLEADEAERQRKASAEERKFALDLERLREHAAAEIQISRMKAEADIALARDKMERTFAIRQQEMELEASLAALSNQFSQTPDTNIARPDL